MISSQNRLTFDYLVLVFVGAVVACAGLTQDSPVTVVASMLISPLMGPILSIAFGLRTGRASMWRKGVRNETIGVAICLLAGTIGGFAVGPFLAYRTPADVPNEIVSRGAKDSLISGVFVAIASGVGVAIGVMQGGVSTLVGVAISAALLPPVVNCGLCFALHFTSTTSSSSFEEGYFMRMAGYSGALFLLNIVCIVICADLTFRVKRVDFAAPAAVRREAVALSGRRRDDEEVTTYVSPDLRDDDDNDGIGFVDALLCRDGGNRPLIATREMAPPRRRREEEEEGGVVL